MASEKAISEGIQRLVKRRGGWSVKFHGSAATRRGVPDRLICYRGRFLAVEEKKPGGKSTLLQQHELDQIAAAGGLSMIATAPDQVEAVLDGIDAELGRST
jgi:hypothetical protein